jgi:hypothetical protein
VWVRAPLALIGNMLSARCLLATHTDSPPRHTEGIELVVGMSAMIAPRPAALAVSTRRSGGAQQLAHPDWSKSVVPQGISRVRLCRGAGIGSREEHHR